MKISKENYDKVSDLFKDLSDLKGLMQISKEFIDENADSSPWVIEIITRGIIANPNMLTGFLIAWKICSVEIESNELAQLKRMMETK